MSKLEGVITKAKEHIDKYFAGHKTDEDMLRKVTKGLGPSIYSADSGQVSCTSDSEKDTVVKKFLMKKHGMTDEAAAKKAVDEVCEQYKAARNKSRPVFYYVLVKKLGLEGNYA